MRSSLSIVASALLFFAVSSEASFIDRIAFLRKQERIERAEAASDFFASLPLFNSKLWTMPSSVVPPKSQTFSQKLDHFSSEDARSFKQRYWVDSSNAAGSNAPVIYYICGESRCTGAASFAKAVAKEIGGYVVTLEHRYYGDSIPFAQLNADTLKYLSVDQALADLADFEKFAKSNLGLTGPWISMGGSYSGSLSAYYRLSYPDLVVGALASSGPVEARTKFEEYDHSVATVVSPKCLSRIQTAVSQLEAALPSPRDAKKARKAFGSKKVENDVSFLYVAADMAAVVVQYGDHEAFCKKLEATSDANLLSVYGALGRVAFAALGLTPFEDVAEGNLSEKASDYSGNSAMRQWYYQSCTEFGYWQVAYHDPKFSARSPRIDLSYHDALCDLMFGIKHSVDTDGINDKYYRPLVDGKANRIFFTNGSDDPWKNLSISSLRGNVPATVDAMEIPGAAHCDDLNTFGSSDEVVKAQTRFRSLVADWLK